MYEFNDEQNNERFIGKTDEYKLEIEGSSENINEKMTIREQEITKEALEKYMPIGSIVTLKEEDKLIMIMGFNYAIDGNNYDYIACEYPFGVDYSHGLVGFMHEQIERIYHIGYVNDQERYFKSELIKLNKNNETTEKYKY